MPFRPGFCASCSYLRGISRGAARCRLSHRAGIRGFGSLPSDLRPLSVDSLVSLLSLFSLLRWTPPHFFTASCSTHRHCESRNVCFGADRRPPAGLSRLLPPSYLTEADLPNPRRYFPHRHQKMIPPRFSSLHGMIGSKPGPLQKRVARLWPPLTRRLLSSQSACPGLPGRIPESGYKAVPAAHDQKPHIQQKLGGP